MKNAWKWAAGAAGLAAFGISPYLWLAGKGGFLVITVPLVLIWACWLMTEYLRWAEKLGKK